MSVSALFRGYQTTIVSPSKILLSPSSSPWLTLFDAGRHLNVPLATCHHSRIRQDLQSSVSYMFQAA